LGGLDISPVAAAERRHGAIPDDDVSAWVVAFYLPQFHPIPENDGWWGPGFTEWTNVRSGTPQFDGHHQPRVPGALGYYDLRDPDTHIAQANLAHENGVRAFCYYAYYFGGRRLLEQPLNVVTERTDLAMPYAICWANESWSRRWDGSDHEVLVQQTHSPETDAGFIDAIANHLGDSRYLRVHGRPVIVLYRAGILTDPLRATDALRERATKLGLGEPYLAMVQSFGHSDPTSYGFDAAIEFPPHPFDYPAVLRPTYPGFRGRVLSYPGAVRLSLSRPAPAFPWFRGVMPDWDNSARRGSTGLVFVGSTPELFGDWVRDALRFTYLHRPLGERLLFVNAWNEWGEGAYLEPDGRHGDAYLRALRQALMSTGSYATESARLFGPSGETSELLRDARAGWYEGVELRLNAGGAEYPASPLGNLGYGEQVAPLVALRAYRTIRRIRPLYVVLKAVGTRALNVRRWIKARGSHRSSDGQS